jgi:hypothetical protein
MQERSKEEIEEEPEAKSSDWYEEPDNQPIDACDLLE